MLKVYIQDRCPYCNGQAYLPAGEASNWKGETYTRYAPSQMCEGTGERGKWVSLPDFLAMLKEAQWKHEHTSYRGGMHFIGGDVWDDIEEVCDDCGANLDRQTLGEFILDRHLERFDHQSPSQPSSPRLCAYHDNVYSGENLVATPAGKVHRCLVPSPNARPERRIA